MNSTATLSLIFLAGSGILLRLTACVAALCRKTVTLLRQAREQHAALEAAKQEGVELQKSYREVLENLPIGLFTYDKGKFQYTNWAWDEQVLRRPGEAPEAAFVRGLHAEDRLAATRELERCCRLEEPFFQKLRLV